MHTSCWYSKDHPDPFCDNMLLLAKAIKENQEVPRGHQCLPEDFAIFYDVCATHSHDLP